MEPRIPLLQSRAAVHESYTRERDTHTAEFARLSVLDRTYSNWRLVVFALLLVTGALAVSALNDDVPIYIILPLAAAVVFVRLLIRHDRVLNDLDRAKRLVDYYEAGLARLEDRWAGKGESGARYRDHHHPYSEDLDLFGAGSLFELLCNTRTRMGQDRLADWLRAPADSETVALRQVAVAELAAMPDLRRDLATSGIQLHTHVSAATLINWGEAPIRLRGTGVRIAAAMLSIGTFVAGIAWIAGTSPLPFVALAAISQSIAAARKRQIDDTIRGIDEPIMELSRLSELLTVIETQAFNSDLLRRIQTNLAIENSTVAWRIGRLARIKPWLDARQNIFVAPFAVLFLWTFQLAYAIENWRDENGEYIPKWLEALSEVEALCSLATYAYENPQDSWPNIEDRLIVEAIGLGHPLLPLDRMVRNDVGFSSEMRLLIVSGSNMSGKSTLLRALGVNVVLAFAGAPVRAERLVISRVNLGASIRTLDSLQEGVSRFYAEISRLRQILEIARTAPPCLFLLDEILHGTNSHDRRIGAEAIATALIEAGAIGLLTTHDLAISQIADKDVCARNIHFEDHLADGKMAFDYKLREGVVRKSNAIELMRSVGLPV